MIRVGDNGLGARVNNFDLLRLFAAMAVLVGHAYTVQGLPGPTVPIVRGYYGGFGVIIFFSISGFLVTRSFVEEPHVLRYARKRALRIFPGLIVAVTLTALVLGPFVSRFSVGDYFTSGETWTYLLRNWFSYPLQDHLSGVFQNIHDNPYPFSVNSSLWTLRYELVCYGLVAACGVVGLLNRRLGWLLLVPILVLYKGHGFQWYVVAVFCVGALAYLHRDRIPLHPVILFALLVLGHFWGAHDPEASNLVVVPYFVLFVALWRPLGRTVLTRYGDVSYGIYVYAFPITQTTVKVLGPSVAPIDIILVATFFTYLCAHLSWRFVEKPALRFKRRRAARATAAPAVPA